MQRLHTTDSIIATVGDRPGVAKAIISQPGINTLRDVASLNVDKLIALIAPDAEPETDGYKQARNLPVNMNGQSFDREPKGSSFISGRILRYQIATIFY